MDSPSFTPGWWDDSTYPRSWAVHVLQGDEEVARIELNPAPIVSDDGVVPADVPDLEIARFEVSTPHQGRHVGRNAIRELIVLYPDHRLVAYSEADWFWESLGWQGILHPRDSGCVRTLFVQPVPGR